MDKHTQEDFDTMFELLKATQLDLVDTLRQRDELLEACRAFVEAWEKSLQLEKTDVALRKARAAIAAATE